MYVCMNNKVRSKSLREESKSKRRRRIGYLSDETSSRDEKFGTLLELANLSESNGSRLVTDRLLLLLVGTTTYKGFQKIAYI